MSKPIHKEELQDLASKWLSGKITAEEKQRLNHWLNEEPAVPVEIPEAYASSMEEHGQKIWNRVLAMMAAERKPTLKRALWPKLAISAVAASVLIVAGIYLFKSPSSPEISVPLVINDIAPGSNKATITLSNGKTLSLSDARAGVVVNNGKIAYHDGSLVERTSGPQTIATPAGGTYQITLADGSEVWLNAASSLTYTTALRKNGERRVKLSGEAYFEVAKDEKHPFVVESRGQQVRVLGTHFNISAYEDEALVKTTLLTGSVKINDQILKPGEQALQKDSLLKVRQVDTLNEVAWKRGEFVFKEDDFRTTMRKIARWYNVEIVYESPAPTVLVPGGWVSRSKNISEVLKIMEATGKVHFKVEGRRVTVTR